MTEKIGIVTFTVHSKTKNSPGFKNGTILLSPVFSFVDCMAIIGFPFPSKPSAAPRMKSTWPPNPIRKYGIHNHESGYSDGSSRRFDTNTGTPPRSASLKQKFTRKHASSDRVRDNLPGDVYFDARINSSHLRMLGYNAGPIGVGAGLHFYVT